MHMIIARCSEVMLFEKGSVCVKRAFLLHNDQQVLFATCDQRSWKESPNLTRGICCLYVETLILNYISADVQAELTLLYVSRTNVWSYSMLNPLFKHHSVLQLFLLLLSHKKLYHLCGLIKVTNKSTFQFYAFFIPLLYLYMHSSHFPYQGVCRLIKAWPVLKERKVHLFMHLSLHLKTADRGRSI